jgi:SPOR domain
MTSSIKSHSRGLRHRIPVAGAGLDISLTPVATQRRRSRFHSGGFVNILSNRTVLGKGFMATPINAPMAGEIWHLSIEDLFQPVQEAPRLGGEGPFVINLSVSTAPISIPTKSFAGCGEAHVYQIQVTEDGRTRYRLRLGPFVSEDEADAVLVGVRDTYPGALTATAGAADLRVTASMAAKADTHPPTAQAPTAQVPAEMPVTDTPAPRKVAATKPAAAEAIIDAAEAEISIDIAWPTPALVVPPLRTAPIAPTAAPAAAPPAPKAAAPAVAPKPPAPAIVPKAAAPAVAPKPPAPAIVPKAAAPAAAPPAPKAAIAPAVAQVPVPMAAPVLTEEVTLKSKAPPVLTPPAMKQQPPVQTTAPSIKAPDKPADHPLRQSVAPAPRGRTPFRSPAFRPLAARLTSLQHVVVATAPVPAAREVKKLDKPLDSLESTQTMRALTASELEDNEASRWFVIQLALADHAFDPDAVPNLDIFSEYRLYSVAGSDQGRVVHALRLGFFREEIGAVAVASYLGAYWDKPTIKRVSLAERERFADQRVEARKDVGATGRHAVIEITDELVARRRRAAQFSAPGTTRPE